jgi:formamidopyrimidine-DNA glycosylase
MPELPEVETTCRGLAYRLKGKCIEGVQQRRANLRFPFPEHLAEKLCTARILNLSRRAKYILIELDNQQTILLHLGMSGRLLVLPSDRPLEKHDHIILECEGGMSLRFNDPRRFGLLDLCETTAVNQHRLLRDMGVEPLGSALTTEAKRVNIKVALLDQRVIVGLGNIYVCEALFYSGISPERLACSLNSQEISRLIESIQRVLHAALEAGGSSLRDYVHSDGKLGSFQNHFAVYRREGQPCPKCTCGKAGIQRIIQAGRSTFYCSEKQR